MKIIYKQSMCGKIDNAMWAAVSEGKEIEKIILTHDEYQLLMRECAFRVSSIHSTLPVEYRGIKIVEEK